MRVLSIDAWRDGDGWTWNAWCGAGSVDAATVDSWGWPYSARKVLAWARREGYLSDASKGRCAIEDDGHNIVILDRATREPLYAIEVGDGA